MFYKKICLKKSIDDNALKSLNKVEYEDNRMKIKKYEIIVRACLILEKEAFTIDTSLISALDIRIS